MAANMDGLLKELLAEVESTKTTLMNMKLNDSKYDTVADSVIAHFKAAMEPGYYTAMPEEDVPEMLATLGACLYDLLRFEGERAINAR